nr:HD domain-containing phosphohydrolase [Oscillochloris sp. ZM17-4]
MWRLRLYDEATAAHCERVGKLAGAIAVQLNLSLTEVRALVRAGRLHDIGKLDVPITVLLKDSPLTEDERSLFNDHPLYGAGWIGGELASPITIAVIVSHHERWDGSGYPYGLAGAAIPMAARIVAVADVYDALREERPYKSAWGHEAALSYVIDHAETMFDPIVVAAFAAAFHHSRTTTKERTA